MVDPFILHNDEIKPVEQACISPGQIGALSGWGVFSTIRVSHGVLFEFGRHYARMKHDAELMHVPFPPDPDQLERSLESLAAANHRSECTLRVAVVRNRGGVWQARGIERDYDVYALTAELRNWGRAVRLAMVANGRFSASKFSGAKILSWAHNLTLYEEARDRGFDEVILLNERGEVSECTSANLFVANQSRVWTPPLSSGCLPGVTREVILHQLQVPGVEVAEKDIYPADLERADEVFITSTTRDLLAVVEVEGMKIHHEGAARVALQEAFGRYIDQYVARRRQTVGP
jgi:branched-chain amino acid aminotransferase